MVVGVGCIGSWCGYLLDDLGFSGVVYVGLVWCRVAGNLVVCVGSACCWMIWCFGVGSWYW